MPPRPTSVYRVQRVPWFSPPRWLSEARGTFLDEIPAEEARSLFRKFVAKWNAKVRVRVRVRVRVKVSQVERQG